MYHFIQSLYVCAVYTLFDLTHIASFEDCPPGGNLANEVFHLGLFLQDATMDELEDQL